MIAGTTVMFTCLVGERELMAKSVYDQLKPLYRIGLDSKVGENVTISEQYFFSIREELKLKTCVFDCSYRSFIALNILAGPVSILTHFHKMIEDQP